MDKKKCVIHANCQGEPLAALLGRHPVFPKEYDILHVVNYTRQPLPDSLISRADIFIYQYLGPDWGELGSKVLLSKIPGRCNTVCLPNLFFKHYWPFWDNAPGMDYSDMFLNDLIARGLDKKEVVHLYLYSDLKRFYDLDRLAEESLTREREKEKNWDFKMVDMVLDRFKRELLFNTVNHPGRALSFHVAEKTLELLGFDPFGAGEYDNFSDPYPEFEQPIHPQVAGHFGLEFLDNDAKYHVYGHEMSFVEYVNYYIECKSQNLGDFISYLRVRPGMRPNNMEKKED